MENIEPICEAVHKAYCAERIRQGKTPYWTNGDYNRLDEATKDYDRATVRAVQEFMDNLEESQAERIEELEVQNKLLREAVGLLNSMILAGEKHSEESKTLIKQALKG